VKLLTTFIRVMANIAVTRGNDDLKDQAWNSEAPTLGEKSVWVVPRREQKHHVSSCGNHALIFEAD
jgi:hypothetical protein